MLTQSDLGQFTGTESYYRHTVDRQICYTDGVKFLADKAGAYWLIDEIVFLQRYSKIQKEEFQVWKLVVEDSSAVLSCENGDGKVVFRKDIPFTDFPLPTAELWLTNDVILLRSEY